MNPFTFRLCPPLSVMAALLLLQACAVPVPPTGGPPDSTPPSLSSSEPESGSVNVATDRLTFEFSEPVDRTSFLSAFSITPELDGPIDVRGSSRRLEVRLPDALREETTYRVTLDVSLRDQRGVTLSAPITLAFATGPEMDRGRLSGHILRAGDGGAASGIDVLAFAAADSASFADGPLYRTQTGSDGRFTLDFLPNRSFFVVGLRDGNRNRRIDEGEWIAVPPVVAVQADTADTAIEAPWILSDPDQTPPTVERVRAVADNELEIRLSEALSLRLDDPLTGDHALMLTDSSGTSSLPVTDLWFRQDRPRNLYALAPGLRSGAWRLEGSVSLTDSVGNPVEKAAASFTVPEGLPAPDAAAFLRWTPDSLEASAALPQAVRTVWPMERAGFRLTRPDTTVTVTFSDTAGVALDWEVIRGDATWITWETGADAPDPYVVSVAIPGADSSRSIQLRTATSRQLGALGLVIDPSGVDPEWIQGHLFPASGPGRRVAEAGMDDDLMLFNDLPGGFRGRAVVFADRDGDGRWSPGSLIPYVPAEPLRWHAFSERVRARWDTIAADTLSFGPTMEMNPGE